MLSDREKRKELYDPEKAKKDFSQANFMSAVPDVLVFFKWQ